MSLPASAQLRRLAGLPSHRSHFVIFPKRRSDPLISGGAPCEGHFGFSTCTGDGGGGQPSIPRGLSPISHPRTAARTSSRARVLGALNPRKRHGGQQATSLVASHDVLDSGRGRGRGRAEARRVCGGAMGSYVAVRGSVS